MKRMMMVVLTVVVLGIPLWADGDGPTRELTPEEKSFCTSTLQAAQNALPPAPDGWQQKIEDWQMPKTVPAGAAIRPIQLEVEAQYQRPANVDMGAMLQDGAGLENMVQKMQEVGKKLEDAIAKGDQAEIARVQQEMQAVTQSNPTVQRLQASDRDQKMHSAQVSIRINDLGVFDSTMKEITPPVPGVIALRRQPSPANGSEPAGPVTTALFVGHYKKTMDGTTVRVQAEDEKGSGAKVRGLSLKIEAFPQVADEFIGRADWQAIAALVR